MIPLDPAGLEAAARQLAENERLAPNGERARDSAAEVVRAYLAAAGRAAATPDLPKDERRPWPIAPDTVMPSRRQPVRWGSRADDPPTEIHDDPEKTKAYLAGLAAGRTEAAAASPDERLREALDAAALTAAGQNMANTLERNCPCYCDHPLRAGLPPCSRCSSLAAWRAVTGSSEPRKETT